MVLGIILIVIGVIMLFERLGLITGEAWNYIWPVLIILLGAWLVTKKHKKAIKHERQRVQDQSKIKEVEPTPEDQE